MKANQYIDFNLRAGLTFKSIFSENAGTLFKELMKGFSLQLKVVLWKRISDALMTTLEELDDCVKQKAGPMFSIMGILVLLKLNGSMDF